MPNSVFRTVRWTCSACDNHQDEVNPQGDPINPPLPAGWVQLIAHAAGDSPEPVASMAIFCGRNGTLHLCPSCAGAPTAPLDLAVVSQGIRARNMIGGPNAD